MDRSFRLGLIAALLVGLGALLWWTGEEAPVPGRQRVDGLTDSVLVRWSPRQLPVIETPRPRDAMAALGYVHGLKRGWTVALWRQTALGTLSNWFGPGLVPLDRHVRRLGLARRARAAYRQLPPSQQARLRAYAAGMNAALRSEAGRSSDAFLLLDLTPARWAPWHALLVERLLAWLATPPLSPPSTAPAAVRRFADTDRQLRRWLHLHGWGRSLAWAVRGADGSPLLFQRHVLGASALPVVQEVRWRRGPADRQAWGTLPGSLLFPTGTSADTAWASLLHSPARLARVAVDSARYRRWHERITPAGGDEQLLRVERFGDQLPLAPAAPPDSVRAATASDSSRAPAPHAWVLRWPGLSPGTDLGPWLRRGRVPGAASGPAAFRLFAPDGLRATGDGGLTVLGTPPVRVRDGDRLRVVGRSAWARFQAQSLRAQARAADTTAVARWVQSDSSTWAAALRPRLERALRPLAAAEGPLQTTATYVRNWDHRYDRMSIGALVFDEWMRAYRAEIGRLPRPADTTAYFARYRLRRAFRRAHARLRARFGPDVRQWRWGRVATDRRYFPVWSADSLVARSLHDLSTTRYAPIDRTGRGHPSTLAGGPSRVAPLPVAPSPDAWEAWMPPGGPVTVRRHRYDPGRLFARSRLRTDPPRPHRLAPDSLPYKTLLLPAPQ